MDCGIERHIHDEATGLAEDELDVAGREPQCLVPVVDEQAAVDGDAALLEEADDVGGPAGAACRRHPATASGIGASPEVMRGEGTGTMNRPPRRAYSACCSMISRRKFQASRST